MVFARISVNEKGCFPLDILNYWSSCYPLGGFVTSWVNFWQRSEFARISSSRADGFPQNHWNSSSLNPNVYEIFNEGGLTAIQKCLKGYGEEFRWSLVIMLQ